jgi:propionyl-CoA synthetase
MRNYKVKKLELLTCMSKFNAKDSITDEKKLLEQVVKAVRDSIGPVAAFKNAVFVDKLPKTRSGKISRSTLKDMLNNKPFKVSECLNIF